MFTSSTFNPYRECSGKIEPGQVLLVYLIAKSEGIVFSRNSNEYSGICDLVNELFSDKAEISQRQVGALLRHLSRRKLGMRDFLPNHLERAYIRAIASIS